MITDPLYQNTLISGNGKTTAVIAVVKKYEARIKENNWCQRLERSWKDMAEKSADKNIHTILQGLPL